MNSGASLNPEYKNRKIRFGLVGCGRISFKHIESIQSHQDRAELTAVCDIDAKALENAVASTGARGYSDFSEMLAKSEVDIVSISAPSGLHPELAIQAARAGKHVISEKPMAVRWQDGLDMIRVCRESGVQLFVVMQNRFNPTVSLLRDAIQLGRFGRIYMITSNVFWTRPQSYYDQSPWRGTWKLDGGALMNQASHYVDLLSSLFGPVESVSAFTGTLARKIEAEDTAAVALKWKSGALGSINVTMLTYPKNLEGSLTVLGEKGTVRISGVALNKISQWEFQEPHPDDEKVSQANYETASVYGSGHPLYYENVLKALRGEASALIDGAEGLKSLELLCGIYKSVRETRPVTLPFE